MELAAFIPATTMIKLARIKSAGALAVRFTLPFIEHPFTPSVFPLLPRGSLRQDREGPYANDIFRWKQYYAPFNNFAWLIKTL
jgi:hypothetical protein